MYSTTLSKLQFEVNIVKHCNLNCQMCDHFSPLSDPEYLSVISFKEDIEQLAKIFKNEAKYIYLLGGEPTLHPQITKFMQIASKNFPSADIAIYTNGLSLLNLDEQFFSICREFNIGICITKYPIPFDYTTLETDLRRKRIRMSFVNTRPIKTSSHYPLDLSGNQNIEHSFFNCKHANNCITLEKGRLFSCSIAPNIYIFNNFFNINLQISEGDYVDIYKVSSANEILKKLSQPMPFCRYCNISKCSHNHPWNVSQCNILEWT